jgi:hypothetical protein
LNVVTRIDAHGRRAGWPAAIVLVSCFVARGWAGEIPGVPPPRLPRLDVVAELYDVNDNLGRGKAVDDFRTEQLGVVVNFGERWLAAVDDSVLTLDKYANSDPDGRLDQLSASVGYRLLKRDSRMAGTAINVGAGVRVTNNFGGAQIQNGFHQIVSDRIVTSPYVDSDDTDLTTWVQADHTGSLPWGRDATGTDAWQPGYWLHGATLVTSDGQWDGTAIANLTLGRGLLDFWLGLRGDWRSGYDQDPVQSRVADNEAGAYVSVGVRYGPVVVETVQGFDDDKAFGRVSAYAGIGDGQRVYRFDTGSGLTAGVTIPLAQLVLQGRLPMCRVFGCSLDGRWRVFGDVRYGKPALGTAPDKYAKVTQLAVGIEHEDRPGFLPRWLAAYGAVGAGWRREELFGELDLTTARADAEDSAVLTGEAGVRAAMQPASQDWRLRVQLGLSGWLPTNSQRVAFGDGSERILKPDASLLIGATLDF